MKTNLIFLTALLLLAGSGSARAQCGMMGSGGHKHGEATSSTHGDHSGDAHVGASKAYAFINDEGIQEATILINDGYHPNTLVVKKGISLRLNFDLQEENCTGTVIFEDFGVKKDLEPSRVTAVEFIPDKSGTFTFSCPMQMIEGTLVVKE